jgi:hypothetical protein
MASILQVSALTIVLLSDVCCGPKLAVVSSQSIMYWCRYTIFSVCLTLYHNLTNIKHLTLYPSLSLISYSRHRQWNYILMIYCNASYSHWIIRANLCARFNILMLLFLNVATKKSENTRSCYDKGDINIGIVPIDRNLCVPFTLCYQDSSSFLYFISNTGEEG